MSTAGLSGAEVFERGGIPIGRIVFQAAVLDIIHDKTKEEVKNDLEQEICTYSDTFKSYQENEGKLRACQDCIDTLE